VNKGHFKITFHFSFLETRLQTITRTKKIKVLSLRKEITGETFVCDVSFVIFRLFINVSITQIAYM